MVSLGILSMRRAGGEERKERWSGDYELYELTSRKCKKCWQGFWRERGLERGSHLGLMLYCINLMSGGKNIMC